VVGGVDADQGREGGAGGTGGVQGGPDGGGWRWCWCGWVGGWW
jgi:hypothetical protein